VIALQDLEVRYGTRLVVRIPRLELRRGEIVALAGESGSGKSTCALALVGLAHARGASVRGSIQFDERELVGLPEREWRQLRGRRIGLVMQSAAEALPPTMRLGVLFERVLRAHGASRADARARSRAAITEVWLEPELLTRFPHELSGGEAQRFSVALAVALRTDLLIADEPTSALDVMHQAEVLALLRRIRDEHGVGVLLISHDLGVLAETAERLVVMRAGEVVEQGAVSQVLTRPAHPHTRQLLAAVPTWQPQATA
jgi:ABC-type glutathione transport system ATPase component